MSLRHLVQMLFCLLVVGMSIVSCGAVQPTNSMTLKVAQNSQAFSYFPLYIAEQEHFFKAQGLILLPDPPTITGNGTKTTAAIETNSAEIAIGTITDAFTVSRIDAHIKILGGFSNDYLIDVVVSKRFEQQTHLTEKSPLADKIKALVGKKIGISAPGSATDALLTYLFRQQGLDAQKDVVKVNLGDAVPLTALAALSSGHVDAVSFPVPTGQEAVAQGIGDIFISPVLGDVLPMKGMVYGVIYAKQSVIDEKPKAVQALIRVIAQTEAWIYKNPDQVAKLLQKYLKLDPKITNTVAKAAMSSVPQTPRIDKQAYETANQFHVDAGLLAIALGYNDLVATDTINKALA